MLLTAKKTPKPKVPAKPKRIKPAVRAPKMKFPTSHR